MSKQKEVIISFIKSFLGNCLTALVLALSVLPEGTYANPEFWTAGSIIALLGAVVRSALSMTWKKTLPEAIGGNPR